jgi:hypothetical protein
VDGGLTAGQRPFGRAPITSDPHTGPVSTRTPSTD